MPCRDAAPAAPFQDGIHGNQPTVLENADLTGSAVHLDHAPPGRVGHAVQVSIDGDHAVAGDASFNSQHRLEWSIRQCLQMRLLLGKVFCHDTPRGGMHTPVGDVIRDSLKLPSPIIRSRPVFRREDAENGHIIYNATLRAFAEHYHYQLKA